MTAIRCLLDEAACISAHEPGIIQGEKIILYSEWNNLASQAAQRLRKAGVGPGDRVAVFMANDWRLMVMLAGIIRAGAIACPLSTRLPRAGVAERMKRIDSRHLIAYLAGDSAEGLGQADVIAPDSLIGDPLKAPGGADPIELDRPVLLLFTSGSGGQPKPVVLTYGNLYYNARGANLNMRLKSKDRWLLNLPMYHVSGIGIMFRCILSGASMLIPEMKEKLIDSLIQCKPSYLSVVPAQLHDLLTDPDASMITSLKAVLVGGDALGRQLADLCVQRKWPCFHTYGMTETGSQICTASESDPPAIRVASPGRPLKHREVMIGERHEILVRGPCVSPGYWADRAVVQCVDADGWFHTGDSGSMDENGRLTVTGRLDNLFISGGENVQPEEIEASLLELPAVERVMVVPVAHERFGRRPVAFVLADPFDPAVWRRHLEAKLPRFMVPDAFYPWPAEENGMKGSRTQFAERAAGLAGEGNGA